MDQLTELLGSKTRAGLVSVLALSNAPLTAYRVAKICNTNVAKTYQEMDRLATLGLVETVRGRGGAKYVLVDADLRSLALRLSPRLLTLDSWRGDEARRSRFRAGLKAPPAQELTSPPQLRSSKPTKSPGELQSLARLAKKAFNSKYRLTGKRTYALL